MLTLRPIFRRGAESLHGYDITDHNKLNAAIGSREEYDAWIARAARALDGTGARFRAEPHGHRRAAQSVVDGCARERAQLDVRALLRYRLASAQIGSAATKCCLPILGDQYGRVLERGELQVHFEDGRILPDLLRSASCRSRRAPIDTSSKSRWKISPNTRRKIFTPRLQSILTALEYLPQPHRDRSANASPSARAKRKSSSDGWNGAAQEAPQVQEAIEKALVQINGRPGDARSFDTLDRIAECAVVSARVLAGRRGGNQLSPLLRRERSGGDSHGVAGSF